MHRGFLKLWRSSVDNDMYFAEPFTKWQAWQDILLLTNHKRNIAVIRGISIEVLPGQCIAGEWYLASRWKWSRGKVRRFLSKLSSKTVQQIVQQKNNVCSLITVVNWNMYQSNGTENGTANSTANGQQTVQQTDTPKNVKNDEEGSMEVSEVYISIESTKCQNNKKNTKYTKEVIPTTDTIIENKTPQADFIHRFSTFYKDRTGMEYKAGKKDYIIVAQLIKKYGVDALIEKVKILASSCSGKESTWFAKDWCDFDIGALSTHWNRLIKKNSGYDNLAEHDRRVNAILNNNT